MSTKFWRLVNERDPPRAAVPAGATMVPRSDMILYKNLERFRAQVSGREEFSPNYPYPDQYYVYTPYISLKSTPVPIGSPYAKRHMGGHPAYPSLSYNMIPGITTRDSDVVPNQPYWYRHYYGPTYDQMWEYNIVLHQQYLQDAARARRMRHLGRK